MKSVNIKKTMITKIVIAVLISSVFLSGSIVVNLYEMGRIFDHFDETGTQQRMMEVTYQLKLDEMNLDFLSYQNDESVINYLENRSDNNAYEQVMELLQSELEYRQIEIAMIVDKTGQVIANPNIENDDQLFDPQGLVSHVLNNSVNVKGTFILSNEEFLEQDAPEWT